MKMKKYHAILVILVALLFMIAPMVMAEALDPKPIALINITPIIEAFIGLLATLVTVKLIPWIQARTTAQQQEMLRAAVSVAVYAAEQIYGAGKGKEKLMYVKGKLAQKGYHVDIDEIEAAVRDLTAAGASAAIQAE